MLSHSGTSVKGNSLIVKGVTAVGAVPSHVGKVTPLTVLQFLRGRGKREGKFSREIGKGEEEK